MDDEPRYAYTAAEIGEAETDARLEAAEQIATLRSQLEQAQAECGAVRLLLGEALVYSMKPPEHWLERVRDLFYTGDAKGAGAALLAERDRMRAVVLAANVWREVHTRWLYDSELDKGRAAQRAFYQASDTLSGVVGVFQQQGGEGVGDGEK